LSQIRIFSPRLSLFDQKPTQPQSPLLLASFPDRRLLWPDQLHPNTALQQEIEEWQAAGALNRTPAPAMDWAYLGCQTIKSADGKHFYLKRAVKKTALFRGYKTDPREIEKIKSFCNCW